MGCCGQKRSDLRRPVAAVPPRDVEPPPVKQEMQSAVSEVIVEYCGSAVALLHRAVSGRRYTFSSARRARPVAARDAAQMLRDEDFRLPRQ